MRFFIVAFVDTKSVIRLFLLLRLANSCRPRCEFHIGLLSLIFLFKTHMTNLENL